MKYIVRIASALALACLLLIAGGPQADAHHGRGAASGSPLSLPLVQTSDLSSIFNFLGSFTIPKGSSTGFNYYAGALTVSGSTMYLASDAYDPYDTNNYIIGGMGTITLPTLSGTPNYSGTNGTATVTQVPVFSTQIVAPSNYSVASTPMTGDTSATLTSLPAGFAANAGWYVKFSGSNSPDELVTGLTGDTFSWGAALTGSGYSTTVSVHQWYPAAPWGAASGFRITGAMVSGSTLYLTGGTYYDANCNQQLGWLLPVTLPLTSNPSSWGTVNTVQGVSTQSNRQFAGTIAPIPSLWQATLGGTAFVAVGAGLSIDSCYVPPGFNFATFSQANASFSGASVPLSQFLAYSYQGLYREPGFPEQLSYRSFAGPFPTSAPTIGAYTLASAPASGATSVTLSAPFPQNNVTGFYNTSSTVASVSGTSIVLNAPTGGWPESWGANYWIYANFADETHTAYGCGVEASTAVTSGSTATMTITCNFATSPTSGDTYLLDSFSAHVDTPYLITFSDGETRVAQISELSTAIPSSPFTVFATLTGCSSGTCTNTPLLCSPSCSTAVTIAPLGDNFLSEYDGPFGTALIVPGSRSLAVISRHQYGPSRARPISGQCGNGASASNEIPVTPDTTYYNNVQVNLYDLQTLLAQEQGSSPLYAASPYAFADFPGYANFPASISGCFVAPGISWMTYDPVGGILYAAIVGPSDSQTILVEEWQVVPITSLSDAWLDRRNQPIRAANDDHYNLQEAA